MRTPRLPVVDRTDASAGLNGLVLFAERRNLVSARVPSHFNWPLPTVVTLRNTAFCQQSALNAPGYDSRTVTSHFHKQHLPTGLVDTEIRGL